MACRPGSHWQPRPVTVTGCAVPDVQLSEALLDAGGDAVSGVEEEILAFMEAARPAERIFRRSEPDRFGPAPDVDRALDRLARER